MSQFEKLRSDLKKSKCIVLKLPKKNLKNVGSVLSIEEEEKQIRYAIFVKFIEDLVQDQHSMGQHFVQKWFKPIQLGDIKPN